MGVKISEFYLGSTMRVGDVVAGLRSIAGVINDYQFAFPGSGIDDVAGNALLRWTKGTGTCANYLEFMSASSTNAPSVNAAGGDDNVNLALSAKGTGHGYFTGTGAMGVPVGTTAQEPAGFAGGLRYDTDTDYLRYWDVGANAWVDIIAGAAYDTATFITKTNETANLPNSIPLSGIGTGFLANTTGTGVLTARTLTGTNNQINVANGNGAGVPTFSVSSTFLFPGTAAIGGGDAFSFFDSTGLNYAALLAPVANYTASIGYQLPQQGPAVNGYVLSSTTAGVMSWIAATTGSVTAVTATLPLISSGGATPAISMQGLTGLAQGDLIYGDAVANTFARLTKDANATRYLSNQGATNGPSWNQVNLANGVTGVLPEANGGTNQSTYTLGDILYASAANTLSKLAGNTTATQKFLAQTGTGVNSAAPTWQAVTIPSASSVTVDVTQANAFTGGEWVYLNGGTYTAASNASAVTAEVVGVVAFSPPPTAGTFTLQTNGALTGSAGLTAGTVYFLGTAGALTATPPTADNTVVKPLLVANSTTSGIIINFRGEVNEPASYPYDLAFIAGFSTTGTGANVAVQSYGQIVMARTGSFTGDVGAATTAPTGSAMILDIEKNGTTIYTTKPQFAIAATTMTPGTLKTDGTEDFVSGDVITFKITQIGSTIAGQAVKFTLTGVV